MIGQDKIINNLYSYSLDTLPKTLLFLGPFGCGKHTLCKEVGKHFNLTVADITADISFECLSSAYKNVNPTIYMINMSELTEKRQNMILKFIEEPLDGSFIILLSESKTQLLDTICNRCYIVQFEPYRESDLRKIVPDADLSKVGCISDLTPGKLMSISPDQYRLMDDLAGKFVSSLSLASLPNTLTLLGKFNYRDEFDKFDVKTWFAMVQEKSLGLLKEGFSDDYLKIKNVTLEYSKRLADQRLNKLALMESYLVTVWSEVKGVM